MGDASRRRLVAAIVTSFVAAALAVSVNLATEWKSNWFAWMAVAALSLLTFAATMSASERGKITIARSTTHARTTRAWLARRRIQHDQTSAEGMVLEVLDVRPDGTRQHIRAFTEEAARVVIELRRLDVTEQLRELDDD